MKSLTVLASGLVASAGPIGPRVTFQLNCLENVKAHYIQGAQVRDQI